VALVVSAFGDELLGAADFDDGVPGWLFARRWGGLETDLVDGRRRGGDGGAGDFLLNCLRGRKMDERERVIRGERVMWERAAARDSRRSRKGLMKISLLFG